MIRLLLMGGLIIGTFNIYASICSSCNGAGSKKVWKICEKCGGSGSVHFDRTSNYNRRVVDGAIVQGYGRRGVRIFNDGKTGKGVTRCDLCQYGLGDKHNGKVLVVEKCKRCDGTGEIGPACGTAPTVVEKTMCRKAGNKKAVNLVDGDVEMAKLNINTNAFVSYNCRYRKECEHCRRLHEKNGLTKSYCEQCYICKKKVENERKFKQKLDECEKILNVVH